MSRLLHAKCHGDLNLLLNDDGTLYVICPKCREVWAAALHQVERSQETALASFALPNVDPVLLDSLVSD